MILADKAIRCPQCKYETKTAGNAKNSSAFRVLNLDRQRIGVLFSGTCRVIGNDNEPLFSYEKGKLINIKNKMVFTVTPAGEIENTAGKHVGYIENYQQLLSIIHETPSPVKRQTTFTGATHHSKSPNTQQSYGSSFQQTKNAANSPESYLRKMSAQFNEGNYFDSFETSEAAYRLFPNNIDIMKFYASGLSIQISLDEEADAYKYDDFRSKCCKLLEVSFKLKANTPKSDESTTRYERQAHYGLGRHYHDNGKFELAANELSQVNIMQYPYAAAVLSHCHMTLIASINKNAPIEQIRRHHDTYGLHLKNDTVLLKKALSSKNFNDVEKAMVWLTLSLIYVYGYPHVPKNVNYAYDCVKQAYALKPSIAIEEYKKYKKGLFGISYSG